MDNMDKKLLGFGLMRLPQNSDNPTDINQDELNEMVDLFLSKGFTYFDTSFVYHNGESENAIRKALVERHDRSEFTLASKFPTFNMVPEDKVEETFNTQLQKCGVEYFDYYLLHNLNRFIYEGQVKETHLFEHMRKWKEEGKIHHIGFSFHDDAKTLDKILYEHPEVEFVQIVINYYDWDELFIQSKKCYEVIRKHNCKVVVMEPVKGGTLARVPETALEKMHVLNALATPSSYAIRYAASFDGVLTVLSGMSNMKQVRDNVSYMENFESLNSKEREVLDFTKKEIMKTWKFQSDNLELMDDNEYSVPLSHIIRAYNSIMIQPNPGFSAELNYYKSFRSDYDRAFETADYSRFNDQVGFDVNATLKEAIDYQVKNSFQSYVD